MSVETDSDLSSLPLDNEEEEVTEDEPEVYYSEDFISGPFLSDRSTFTKDILEFDFSYGYDCLKYFNLTVPDENTLIFGSGNIIHFFNARTQQFTFRRSAFGGGIGHITRNPQDEYPHIAVGENGINPPIIIYEWPSLEIITVLKGGASRCFAHLNYSPDGVLLASQSGEPDFLITIFNWSKCRILQRIKSNVNEVYRVMFSTDVPGQLTTCGLTHIKFWKMAETFTGLKLQGELGRFGKTEYCDILGIYQMADEKVVSGCAWGNMLVWDEGLIKVEVCQVGRKKCHTAPIVQFHYDNGDLWTVGMDGCVRVWFYDTIDQFDPPDHDRFVEVDPLFTFYVPDSKLMCIRKLNNKWRDFQFYAQDGNGGLWRIDLNTYAEPKSPVQLFACHGGEIMDIAACPWGNYLASVGSDGRLQFYNYKERRLFFRWKFPAKGATLIWLPLEIQPSGDQLIMGFDDGIIRVVVARIDEDTEEVKHKIIQLTKPHTKPITRSSLNSKELLLVTGSEDATIFIYKLVPSRNSYTTLVPIGFIPVPDIITCLLWHPKLSATLLGGCAHGHYFQVEVPNSPQKYTTVTYKLKEVPTQKRFITYKSQILRDILLAEIAAQKAKKVERKKVELAQLKTDNPGMDIDEELFLEDSSTEEILESLFIPEVPNNILWLQVTDDDTIWLSVAGYDAGYIYEYDIDQTSEVPKRFQLIYDGVDMMINNYIYSNDGEYLILALENGSLRVIKRNPEDWTDLSDYWQLPMHDNYNSYISKMCFSYDDNYFFSAGYDGNLFSYRYNSEVKTESVVPPQLVQIAIPTVELLDVDGYTSLSLDETLQKAEKDRIDRIANEAKVATLERIIILRQRFDLVLKRNAKLLPTQIIPRPEFDIDPRITENLNDKLTTNLALVKQKLEYNVEKSKVGMDKLKSRFVDSLDVFPIIVRGVRKNITVATERQTTLSTRFFDMLQIVDRKILEAELKNRPPERPPPVQVVAKAQEVKKEKLEHFLVGLTPSTIAKGLEPKLARCLGKYRDRKNREDERRKQWIVFNSKKPQEGVNDPEEENLLEKAKETIGDLKLKTALDYKVPMHLRESTVKKYKQLLLARHRQYYIRHDFNLAVLRLRNQKCSLIDYLNKLKGRLLEIQEEICPSQQRQFPEIPKVELDDFPEQNVDVVVKMSQSQTGRLITIPTVQCRKGDALEKEVLLTNKPTTTLYPPPPPEKGKPTKVRAVDPEIAALCNDEDTPWEAEVRSYRYSRYIFEQDRIISKMKVAIEKFDAELERVAQSKIKLTRDAYLIDLYIVTLNQELTILSAFESVEDQLQERLNERILEKLDMEDTITVINNTILNYKMEIERLQEEEKSIQQQFYLAAVDNKFYDFLRRIFKRRYKPPKVYNPDESSSSSSSSSSSESETGDAGSEDSRDFAIVKLDENVCPKGCDAALYERTFEMRAKRHSVELAIRDQKANIDTLSKDLVAKNKKMKIIDNFVKECQKELEAYQREKQKKLNLVLTTVVLKLNQLQHLVSINNASKVGDALILSKYAVSQLYRRVGELHNETVAQKSKHKGNITHMTRMQTDSKFMRRKMSELKAQIKELMIKKFGGEIDLNEVIESNVKTVSFGKNLSLDELEECTMKKMVFDYRLSHEDVQKLFQDEMALWNNAYERKQLDLIEKIRQHTSKLDLIALLNKEKAQLALEVHKEAVQRDSKKLEADAEFIGRCQDDINKLMKVVHQQALDIRLITLEISRLRSKDGVVSQKTDRTPKEPLQVEEDDINDDDSFMYYLAMETTREKRKIPSNVRDMSIKTQSSLFSTISQRIKSLIVDMLGQVKSTAALSKSATEILVEETVIDLLERPDREELVENLTALLPEEPTGEDHGIIETVAEQILVLQQPEVSKSESAILHEMLDLAIESGGSYTQILVKAIFELVNRLPISFLTRSTSIHIITSKVKTMAGEKALEKEELEVSEAELQD
ncbi:cilia- and flagella-associated protein 44-like [Photinus pyralis]|uniref:cilia- and flagella-associated protein 44-like n=1 Tax=Photinus pyralis TaxID=7054 RepID=UPI0012672D81|nr:cilia- and flagella-associated protein 44-like [Photinus pyralis]